MDRHKYELKKIRTEIRKLNTNKSAEAPAPGNGKNIAKVISSTINLIAFIIFACIVIAIFYFIF